ncbi:VanW family protein [Deinococcus maricopensis]|nr:VanW family protein [Deinococcus maricopensis]
MKAWTIALSSLALLGGALALGAVASSNDTIAPGIHVGGVDLGGLDERGALQALQAHTPSAPDVTVRAAGRSWVVPAADLGWAPDPQASIDAAVQASRDRNLGARVMAALGQADTVELPLRARVNVATTRQKLAALVKPLETAPVDARIVFDKTRYTVVPDRPGVLADVSAAANTYAASPDATTLEVSVSKRSAALTAAALQVQVDAGNKLVRPMTFTLGERKTALTALQVANLFWVRAKGIELDEAAITRAMKTITSNVDRPARNARYALQGGALVRVKEQPGVVTDVKAALPLLRKAITTPSLATMALPSTTQAPTLTVNALPEVKKLTLIATGSSTYYGSSGARATNVSVAASKINGAVVAPGETFSFLNALGSISPENGFVGGLIISGGRTVDGLGGGVCQVSTTTFRALYQAGLPVVERNQHAYRVHYYDPQVGFEAAVYDPGLDLKMKNDTNGPILIRTVNHPAQQRLEVQVWGLPQTRKVTVSPATILARIPHPAPQYVTTPNLRRGQTRQVDWAVDGYNLYITRTIRDGGTVRTDKVSTNYKPWRAVYEVGSS